MKPGSREAVMPGTSLQPPGFPALSLYSVPAYSPFNLEMIYDEPCVSESAFAA